MKPSSSGTPGSSPPSSADLLSRTFAYLDRLLVLALVPLVTSLVNVSDLLATAQTRGMSVTASFPVTGTISGVSSTRPTVVASRSQYHSERWSRSYSSSQCS